MSHKNCFCRRGFYIIIFNLAVITSNSLILTYAMVVQSKHCRGLLKVTWIMLIFKISLRKFTSIFLESSLDKRTAPESSCSFQNVQLLMLCSRFKTNSLWKGKKNSDKVETDDRELLFNFLASQNILCQE